MVSTADHILLHAVRQGFRGLACGKELFFARDNALARAAICQALLDLLVAVCCHGGDLRRLLLPLSAEHRAVAISACGPDHREGEDGDSGPKFAAAQLVAIFVNVPAIIMGVIFVVALALSANLVRNRMRVVVILGRLISRLGGS